MVSEATAPKSLQRLAAQYGGRLVPMHVKKTGRLAVDYFAVELPAGPVRVLIEAGVPRYEGSDFVAPRQINRGRAYYPVCAGPRYAARRHGFLRKLLGKTLARRASASAISIPGDETFARDFAVTGPDASATRRAWSARARELFARPTVRSCEVKSREAFVDVIGGGDWEFQEERLIALFELTAELGRFDFYGRAALEALEGASLTPASGPWDARKPATASLLLRGQLLQLTPLGSEQGAFVEVRCDNRAQLPSCEVTLGQDAVPTMLGAALVAFGEPDVIERLGRPRAVCTPAHVALHVPAAEVTTRDLQRAAELVATWAEVPLRSAFR